MTQLKLDTEKMRNNIATIEADLKNEKIVSILDDHIYMFDKSVGEMKFDDAKVKNKCFCLKH